MNGKRLSVSLTLNDKQFQSGLRKATKSIQKFGKSMQRTGESLSKNLSAPIALAGFASIKMASDFEESLNKTFEENIALTKSVSNLERAEIVRNASVGLALTEAEKLASLVEDIDFDSAETFEMKVNVVKESYFKTEAQESVDEAQNLVGTDEAPADVSDTMARYTSAISKYNKV